MRPAKRSAWPKLTAARDWALFLALVSAVWWCLPYPSPVPVGAEGQRTNTTKVQSISNSNHSYLDKMQIQRFLPIPG